MNVNKYLPITDKQRIDFVQRHGLNVTQTLSLEGMFTVRYWTVYALHNSHIKDWRKIKCSTWRQAVDKAIRAYNGGK